MHSHKKTRRNPAGFELVLRRLALPPAGTVAVVGAVTPLMVLVLPALGFGGLAAAVLGV